MQETKRQLKTLLQEQKRILKTYSIEDINKINAKIFVLREKIKMQMAELREQEQEAIQNARAEKFAMQH